jgi:transcriptional regulator with XRE-family HTH domain
MIDASADVRRQDLAELLRARRASMRPSDVGLVRGRRRHVPGLRREEVAALAGISTTWYTWIEQGRPINISPDALEKIGSALKFEIDFMQSLLRDEPQRCTKSPDVPDALRTLVESHVHAPAYIATPRLDLLVWNPFVTEIFGYHAESSPLERNILWRMFFDGERRALYVDWEAAAGMTAGNFRSIYTRYRGDEYFEELLDAMLQSNDFKRFWDAWTLLIPGRTPPFSIRHEKIGLCEVTPIQATLDIAPDCYLALYSCIPHPTLPS